MTLNAEAILHSETIAGFVYQLAQLVTAQNTASSMKSSRVVTASPGHAHCQH